MFISLAICPVPWPSTIRQSTSCSRGVSSYTRRSRRGALAAGRLGRPGSNTVAPAATAASACAICVTLASLLRNPATPSLRASHAIDGSAALARITTAVPG